MGVEHFVARIFWGYFESIMLYIFSLFCSYTVAEWTLPINASHDWASIRDTLSLLEENRTTFDSIGLQLVI